MSKKSNVGRALINNKKKVKNYSDRHTTDYYPPLKSVVQQSNLEEYLSLASLSNKQFHSEKQFKLAEPAIVQQSYKPLESYPLQLPFRPEWSASMSASELDALEKEAFLEWRRSIASLQESNLSKVITPFEKNLGVWRQLWKTIEISSVVCQIIDARNPLFFRNPDLENYIRDAGKSFYLILNKADLIPEEVRSLWAEYFDSIGIPYLFFSAVKAQSFIDRDLEPFPQFESGFMNGGPHIHSRLELLEKLGEGLMIGFVGYPNVGKSSVINALTGRKTVGVAAQPGKTKHIQTLELEKHKLCDCPGLVFPSFVSAKAEMVVCGVLPIDQVKDVHGPVETICMHVPSRVLEETYGIKLGGRVSATTFLQKVATHRAFYTGSGLPDEFKTGKMVLKDFVNGKLQYYLLPPGFPVEIEDEAPPSYSEDLDIDRQFFGNAPPLILADEKGVVLKGNAKLTKQERREMKFAAKRGEDMGKAFEEIMRRKQQSAYSIKSQKN